MAKNIIEGVNTRREVRLEKERVKRAQRRWEEEHANSHDE